MRNSNLISALKKLPADYEVCLSRYFVIDKKQKITAVVDAPLIAICNNKEGKEIRFCIEDGRGFPSVFGSRVISKAQIAEKREKKKKE